MESFLRNLNRTTSFFKSLSSRSTSPSTTDDKSNVQLDTDNFSDLRAAKKPCMLEDSNSSSELVSLSLYRPLADKTVIEVLVVKAPESDFPGYDEYKAAGLTI